MIFFYTTDNELAKFEILKNCSRNDMAKHLEKVIYLTLLLTLLFSILFTEINLLMLQICFKSMARCDKKSICQGKNVTHILIVYSLVLFVHA